MLCLSLCLSLRVCVLKKGVVPPLVIPVNAPVQKDSNCDDHSRNARGCVCAWVVVGVKESEREREREKKSGERFQKSLVSLDNRSRLHTHT